MYARHLEGKDYVNVKTFDIRSLFRESFPYYSLFLYRYICYCVSLYLYFFQCRFIPYISVMWLFLSINNVQQLKLDFMDSLLFEKPLGFVTIFF